MLSLKSILFLSTFTMKMSYCTLRPVLMAVPLKSFKFICSGLSCNAKTINRFDAGDGNSFCSGFLRSLGMDTSITFLLINCFVTAQDGSNKKIAVTIDIVIEN